MKFLLLFLIPFFLLVSGVKASSNQDESNQKKFSINPALNIGIESGLSFRMEWENVEQRKLILNTDFGLFFKDDTYIMLDLGVGYGYPLINSNGHALFANGLLTFMQQTMPVGMALFRYGPTAKLEFEYRKTWNKFSVQVAPNCRQMVLFSKFMDYPWNVDWRNSFGLRLGLMYSFTLNGSRL